MKKLVIFDLDGTLLNTIADLAAATNHALQHYGYPTHDTDAYRYFVGNGINKLFERALPETERTEANVLKIRSQFIPYYNYEKRKFGFSIEWNCNIDKYYCNMYFLSSQSRVRI